MELRPGATATKTRQRHAVVLVISERKCALQRCILAIAEILFRDFWFHSFALFPLRCSWEPRRIQKVVWVAFPIAMRVPSIENELQLTRTQAFRIQRQLPPREGPSRVWDFPVPFSGRQGEP